MFSILFVILALVESFIELVKMGVKTKNAEKGGLGWVHLVAFVSGWLLLWLFGIDILLFAGLVMAVNVPAWAGPIISAFFGAVLIVRYTGNLHGLLDWLNGLKK